jgi:hypothetical protein
VQYGCKSEFGTAIRIRGRCRRSSRDWPSPIADKAFDSNAIIAELDVRGAKVVVSQHPRCAKPLAIDEEITNGGTWSKGFKRIGMRATRPIKASPQ